jgi:hypothetical protein
MGRFAKSTCPVRAHRPSRIFLNFARCQIYLPCSRKSGRSLRVLKAKTSFQAARLPARKELRVIAPSGNLCGFLLFSQTSALSRCNSCPSLGRNAAALMPAPRGPRSCIASHIFECINRTGYAITFLLQFVKNRFEVCHLFGIKAFEVVAQQQKRFRRSLSSEAGSGTYRCPIDLKTDMVRRRGSLGTKSGFNLGRIEADDHGSIDDGDWGRHVTESLELCDSTAVLGYVPILKRNSLLRKILFRPLAEHSARLREYRYCFRHFRRLLERLPDTCRAQLSLIRSPAGTAGGQLAVHDNGCHRADAQ